VRADSADGPMHLIVTFRATNIHSALKRILQKVRQQNFNCFEVTGIVAKRFRDTSAPDTRVKARLFAPASGATDAATSD